MVGGAHHTPPYRAPSRGTPAPPIAFTIGGIPPKDPSDYNAPERAVLSGDIAERVGIDMTEPQEVPYIPRKEEMDCVVQRRRDCQTTKTTDYELETTTKKSGVEQLERYTNVGITRNGTSLLSEA